MEQLKTVHFWLAVTLSAAGIVAASGVIHSAAALQYMELGQALLVMLVQRLAAGWQPAAVKQAVFDNEPTNPGKKSAAGFIDPLVLLMLVGAVGMALAAFRPVVVDEDVPDAVVDAGEVSQ